MALVHNKSITVITVWLSNRSEVRLMPGVNEIEDGELLLLRTHPSVLSRIKNGKIEILQEEKVGPDGKRPIAEMLKYIPKFYDVKLLRKIIREDGREEVVQAAKDQIELIMNDKKEGKKQENAHFS